MVPSLLCIFVAHIIFLHVFFHPPFILSLSLSPSSLFLAVVARHVSSDVPFTTYPLLNQSYFFTPYPSIAHINSPTIHRLSFTTTILRAAWKTFFSLSGQPSSSCLGLNLKRLWPWIDCTTCPVVTLIRTDTSPVSQIPPMAARQAADFPLGLDCKRRLRQPQNWKMQNEYGSVTLLDLCVSAFPFLGTASFYNFWDSSRYVKFGRHWAHIWNSLEFLGKGHLVSVCAGVPQPFKWIITPGPGCFGLSCKHIGKDDTSEIHMPFQFGVKWDSRSLGHHDKLTHTL